MKARVGLIGVGAISDWHVRALRTVGLEVTAVASRAGSTRVTDFATRWTIARAFSRWEDLLAEPRSWDGLVIATQTDGTPEVMAAALDLNVPILVEKPVGWSSARLARLAEHARSPVIVGFNRRFYRPVQYLRDDARAHGPVLAGLCLPDAIDAGQHMATGRPYWEPFFANGSHGMDLLRFVFGPMRVEHVLRMRTPAGAVSGLAATVVSARGDVVQVMANWGTPTNFSLSLERAGRRVDLRPFEVVTIYDGMDVIEPSEEFPVSRYVPRVKERITVDQGERGQKPGFVPQALAFRELLEGGPPSPLAATLEDAVEAIRLCEDLLGERWPETDR